MLISRPADRPPIGASVPRSPRSRYRRADV